MVKKDNLIRVGKKAGIVIDEWKLPVFKKVLKKAGYDFKKKPRKGMPGTLLIIISYENVDDVQMVVEQAQIDCAKEKRQ